MKNYFVASQDKDLRMRVGSVPGVPIIYLNKVTLVLEPPSQDSRDFSKEVRISCVCSTKPNLTRFLFTSDFRKNLLFCVKIESSKVVMSTQEETVLENLLKKKSSTTNNVIGGATEAPVIVKSLERKKRKASAANPLSSMKASDDSNSSKKRKINKFRRA
jgi:Fcf1